VFEYPAAYGWGWGVREHVSDHLPVYLVLGAGQFSLRPAEPDGLALLGKQLGGEVKVKPKCIELNSASAAQLDRLPHIGPARAEDIVAGRPWQSISGLEKLSGLGEARVSDIAQSGLLCAR